eukprot:1141734-Pelagomonas_calceolata.AAC.2
MESLLKNYKYWSGFYWTGGITICVRDAILSVALATQCSPACLLLGKGMLLSYSREPMPTFYCWAPIGPLVDFRKPSLAELKCKNTPKH